MKGEKPLVIWESTDCLIPFGSPVKLWIIAILLFLLSRNSVSTSSSPRQGDGEEGGGGGGGGGEGEAGGEKEFWLASISSFSSSSDSSSIKISTISGNSNYMEYLVCFWDSMFQLSRGNISRYFCHLNCRVYIFLIFLS